MVGAACPLLAFLLSCFLAFFLSLVDHRVLFLLLMLNLPFLGLVFDAPVEFAICRFGNLVFGLLHLPSQVRIHDSCSEQLTFTISQQ